MENLEKKQSIARKRAQTRSTSEMTFNRPGASVSLMSGFLKFWLDHIPVSWSDHWDYKLSHFVSIDFRSRLLNRLFLWIVLLLSILIVPNEPTETPASEIKCYKGHLRSQKRLWILGREDLKYRLCAPISRYFLSSMALSEKTFDRPLWTGGHFHLWHSTLNFDHLTSQK